MYLKRRNFIKTSGTALLGLNLFQNSFGKTLMNNNFNKVSPESQGFDSQGIIDFLNGIKDSQLEWHSFKLIRNGNTISEAWWKPFGPEFKHTLYSLSKSFTSTAIGFLVDEAKLSVEDSVLKFFPEEAPILISENLRKLKVKHLLTMNTGQEKDTLPYMREKIEQTWIKSFFEVEIKNEPGSFFMYNTGATYVLGAIVTKISGLSLEDFLKVKLFEPLEIVDFDWEKSPDGLNVAGYGLRLKTDDIGKFGQLLLQKGKWNGTQLISEKWIFEATKKQTESQKGDNDWSQGYGYQFWRCKPGFYRGDGAYGQFCMVIPEHNAVLIMTGESFNLQKSMDVAYKHLLPAFKKGVLPENPKNLEKIDSIISKLSIPVQGPIGVSNLSKTLKNQVYSLNQNSFGITKLGFELNETEGIFKVWNNKANKFDVYEFGWNSWKTNKSYFTYHFAVANRFPMPSRIAAYANWKDTNILQLNIKCIEAIHGDQITFDFNSNEVKIKFLNSISKGQNENSEKREQLKGLKI